MTAVTHRSVRTSVPPLDVMSDVANVQAVPNMDGDQSCLGGGDTNVKCCPACGDHRSSQIGGVASAFESIAGGKVFHQPAYVIRVCATCALHYKSTTLPMSQLGDYYSRLESETFDYDGNFPTDRLVYDRLGELPAGSHVLDFGCSTGRILKKVSSRLACYGVEVNGQAATVARERGIRVIPEDELQARSELTFDAILLTDVYEHLPAPIALIEMLSSKLKPGGRLLIVTGCVDAIQSPDLIGEFWYFRLVGHLQMLSERHLNWLARRTGLRVDAVHRCSHYDTPLLERFRQYIQWVSYRESRLHPDGIPARLIPGVPFACRAKEWTNAPARTYTQDHVVAVLSRPTREIDELKKRSSP